ncbi:MAG TPA: class I SAM-dependent methyltransferase [Desulfobacterales bacterium]|nr:class I SAM-dependent methyltransferase [Desulfobacterales bacterium]
MRGGGYADVLPVLQVPDNKADAVPCERLQLRNYEYMPIQMTTTIIARTPPVTSVEEIDFSHNFCVNYNRRHASPLPIQLLSHEELNTVKDLRKIAKTPVIFLILGKEMVFSPLAFQRLPELLLQGHWDAVAPVYSESVFENQQAFLPVVYQNFRGFLEIAGLFHQAHDAKLQAVEEVDPISIVVRRDALEKLPPGLLLEEIGDSLIKTGGQIGIAKDILVHRFGDYYGSIRTDLLGLIPGTARRILDVGCARGATGRFLKKKQDCHLTGVEINPVLAEKAKQWYDRVIVESIEEASFDSSFDAILCGDVIEHLRHPHPVLSKLADHLEPGGVIIGSTPNAGHWSIVLDLAQGYFEYIPVGLQCVSHIRWFTESSLRELLEENGLNVEVIQRDCPPATPTGEGFITTLVKMGMGNESSLRTAELRFLARRGPAR